MNFENVFAEIATRVPTDGDTYTGEDGLLYCSRCHTQRQARIQLFENATVVPCICQCMSEQMQAEEAEKKRREKESRLDRYRMLGFDNETMRGYTFANDDGGQPQLKKAMMAYVEHFPELRKSGKGLLLWGDVGGGKTFYAACIVNALIDRGYPCLMTNFARLSNQISATWTDKQEYIDSLSRFSLVAIDDLGVERDTEYMNETVTTVIDSLYRAGVPMIITTNHTPKSLTDEMDIRKRRVYDRILERCMPIKIDRASRRLETGRRDYAEMRKLLGL